MTHFTTRDTFLIPSFSLDEKEEEKLFRFLRLLRRSNVEKFLNRPPRRLGGRPPYDSCDLFATILYGFAFRHPTLRELEDGVKYDLRMIYLMQQERPSHMVFGDFINDYIVDNIEEIYTLITKEIIKECDIDIQDIFIDGTKIEADANKYKFVWKPTTFHKRLDTKIRTFIDKLGYSRMIKSTGNITSSELYKVLIKMEDQKSDKDIKQLKTYLLKCLEYEEKEEICGPDRNSYYKTDHDATAMTLKSDYYSGLGSNMHAAYNFQILVSKGFILFPHVSQSRTDFKNFVPTLDGYHKYYGNYPKNICGDAGYGSYDNYLYTKKHNIGNYLKHQTWQGNSSGKRPDILKINDNGMIVCLGGHSGNFIDIENRHPKNAKSRFYQIDGCKNCEFRNYCMARVKDKRASKRVFEINTEFMFLKKEAEKNLLSPKGIELRVNRSSQVEGAFGVIKEDMRYVRLRRTSLKKVKAEIFLTCLGYNIRKLFRFYDGKANFTYWKAPEDLQSESFKKPRAKILSRVRKKKQSVNERARKSARYKRKGP